MSSKRDAVNSIIILITFFCLLAGGEKVFATKAGGFFIQVVKQPDQEVLLEFEVKEGDHFYIDYIHSSDHTPVHDVFLINGEGQIVLIEEDYQWYGAGLEFHPEAHATITFDDKATRVHLYRLCPHFLLRVGRVANHVLTFKKNTVPLKSIANGGDLVWIRVISR